MHEKVFFIHLAIIPAPIYSRCYFIYDSSTDSMVDFKYRLRWLASILSTVLEPIVQWIALVTLLIAAIGSDYFYVQTERRYVYQ